MDFATAQSGMSDGTAAGDLTREMGAASAGVPSHLRHLRIDSETLGTLPTDLYDNTYSTISYQGILQGAFRRLPLYLST
jgi:hypothetical protein